MLRKTTSTDHMLRSCQGIETPDARDEARLIHQVSRSYRGVKNYFRPKVTAITESKDVDSIPVDELIGSLQFYELDLPNTSKSKSMALKSIDDVDVNGFDDELSAIEIAYLAKNFRNFLRNNISSSQGIGNQYLTVILLMAQLFTHIH